jgi:GTP cyclohydrolase I
MPHKIIPKAVNEKHNIETCNLPGPLLVAFQNILDHLSRHNDLSESDKSNYADTVVRSTKAFMDLTKTRTEICTDLVEILSTGFPLTDVTANIGMQTHGPIHLYSFCPHHLLAVKYSAYIAYIPRADHILGLSKITRLAQALASRPVLQEQLSEDIADVLFYQESTNPNIHYLPAIETKGSAVLLTGHHSCISCRGVKSENLVTQSSLRGAFWELDMEQKFHAMITATRAARNSEL